MISIRVNGRKRRAQGEHRHSGQGHQHRRPRQYLAHRHQPVRAAQQQVPKRRMPLTMKAAQHVGYGLALQCDAEGADLVAPVNMMEGEEQRSRQPDRQQQDAQPQVPAPTQVAGQQRRDAASPIIGSPRSRRPQQAPRAAPAGPPRLRSSHSPAARGLCSSGSLQAAYRS
jgi:hypothetical protein